MKGGGEWVPVCTPRIKLEALLKMLGSGISSRYDKLCAVMYPETETCITV